MSQDYDDFDPYAEDYDQLLNESVQWSGGGSEDFSRYKAQWIGRVFGRRGPILDYGCGVGLLSRLLREDQPSRRVDGFDVSASSIARVPQALREEGTFSTDIDAFTAGAYELVVISNVLHHIRPAQRDEVMRQACSRLKRGGSLVVFEHNPLNPATRWVVAQCEFDRDAELLGARRARQLLQRAGLRQVRSEYVLFLLPRFKRLWPYERVLRGVPFGAQYVATGVHR